MFDELLKFSLLCSSKKRGGGGAGGKGFLFSEKEKEEIFSNSL